MLKALNKASHVISNSEFTKNLAIKNGFEEKKIKIINPGCNYPIKIDNKSLETAKESGKFLGQIAAKLRVPLKKLFGYLLDKL